jgi:hypothetical protein
MNVAEWQRRLEETFRSGDVIGARLLPIIEMEKACGERLVSTFHGHNVLADSFSDFYIDTLQICSDALPQRWISSLHSYYPYTVLSCVVNFRSVRAAANLFASGYPLDGYRLLRDLKDRAVFLAAIASRATSWSALLGTERVSPSGPLTEQEFRAARKRRLAEERRVRALMLGAKSGLPPEQVAELRLWENLFHYEVHGALLTTVTEGKDWLEGRAPLSIGPVFNETAAAMYMNRTDEIGWMLVRTLPFLQLKPRAFGEDWAQKWAVLDESFRWSVLSLDKLGKPIARAMVALLDAKFSFSADTAYAERA